MILVSFFSRPGQNYVNGAIRNLPVGNTEVAALLLARLLDARGHHASLFRVESVASYPEDYSLCTQVSLAELKKGARPSLRDMGPVGADVLFLGYPNWWGTMPMPVFTYLEGHDFAGTIIHPFCTHEGSGLGRSVRDIRKACSGAVVSDGLVLHGANVQLAEDKIAAWVDSLGFANACGSQVEMTPAHASVAPEPVSPMESVR